MFVPGDDVQHANPMARDTGFAATNAGRPGDPVCAGYGHLSSITVVLSSLAVWSPLTAPYRARPCGTAAPSGSPRTPGPTPPAASSCCGRGTLLPVHTALPSWIPPKPGARPADTDPSCLSL